MATEHSKRPPIWLLVLLALVSAAAYLRAVNGEFVYDDLLMIERNPLLRDPSRLLEIFSSSYWDFLDPESASRVGYWRPLTALWLAAGYQLGGGTPFAFHLLSILTHAAATLAAFLLAWRLASGEESARRTSIAFFAALLFALHPAQVESVSWITAVNNPLFGLFAFLGLASWVRWRRTGSEGFPLGAAVLFVLAMLSKETAIAMVPALFAVDICVAGRERSPWRPFLRGYGTIGTAFIIYTMARVLVFESPLAGFDRTTTYFGVEFGRLISLRLELLGGFLSLAAWPAELNLFRAFRPELPPGDSTLLLSGLAVLLACGSALIFWRRGAKLEAGGLLFLLVGVSPVILRVQQVGTFPLSDRFLYFAVFGWGLFLAAVLVRRLPVLPAVLILGGVAGAYTWKTWQRQEFWLNEEHLFRIAIGQSPESPNVYWGLGRVLLEKYRLGEDREDLAEAMVAYERAQDLCSRSRSEDLSIFATSDDTLQSNLGVGWCLYLEAAGDQYHDYKTPAELFERLTNNYPQSHLPWAGLAATRTALGELEAAEAAFVRSLELNERDPRTHLNFGILRLERGDCKAAIESFEANLAIRARHLNGHVWLVRALEACGEIERAREVATQAVGIDPEHPEPYILLGNLAASSGDWREARRLFETAIRLRPRHGAAHLQRAKILLEEGDQRGAIVALRLACEFAPENFEAHFNLGQLLRGEDMELAGHYLIRAYVLRPRDERGELLADQLRPLAEQSPVFATELGKADLSRADLSDAREWSQLALDQDGDYAPALWTMGRALQRAGQRAEAAEFLERAAMAMTTAFDVQHAAGRALFGLGQRDRALPYLARALELLPEAENVQAELKPKLLEELTRMLATDD